jgi:hypothetical protein
MYGGSEMKKQETKPAGTLYQDLEVQLEAQDQFWREQFMAIASSDRSAAVKAYLAGEYARQREKELAPLRKAIAALKNMGI